MVVFWSRRNREKFSCSSPKFESIFFLDVAFKWRRFSSNINNERMNPLDDFYLVMKSFAWFGHVFIIIMSHMHLISCSKSTGGCSWNINILVRAFIECCWSYFLHPLLIHITVLITIEPIVSKRNLSSIKLFLKCKRPLLICLSPESIEPHFIKDVWLILKFIEPISLSTHLEQISNLPSIIGHSTSC